MGETNKKILISQQHAKRSCYFNIPRLSSLTESRLPMGGFSSFTLKQHRKKLYCSGSSQSFTLVELLIVIGILAILTAAVVIVLNPADLLQQARDSQRLQDISSLESTINLAESIHSTIDLGTASTVYYLHS